MRSHEIRARGSVLYRLISTQSNIPALMRASRAILLGAQSRARDRYCRDVLALCYSHLSQFPVARIEPSAPNRDLQSRGLPVCLSMQPANTVSVSLCNVCRVNFAIYTCPRCCVRYCCLQCYKAHGSTCTEGFYRRDPTQCIAQPLCIPHRK